MGLTLNELRSIDPDILEPLVAPILSDPLENKRSILYGREWHDIVLRPNILLQCGQFETLHYNPATFREELKMWSGMRKSVWCDLLKTTVQEYELTHNFDRTEEWNDERTIGETVSGTNTGTVSGTNSRDITTNNQNDNTQEDHVAAYNSSEYCPKDKTTVSNTATSSGTENVTSSETGSGKSDSKRDLKETVKNKHRMYGNIGVTTTQQMIEEERKTVLFNIVQYIVNDFKNYFCVLLY